MGIAASLTVAWDVRTSIGGEPTGEFSVRLWASKPPVALHHTVFKYCNTSLVRLYQRAHSTANPSRRHHRLQQPAKVATLACASVSHRTAPRHPCRLRLQNSMHRAHKSNRNFAPFRGVSSNGLAAVRSEHVS